MVHGCSGVTLDRKRARMSGAALLVMVAALWSAAACSLPGMETGPRSATPPRALATCFTSPPSAWAGTPRGSFPRNGYLQGVVTPAGDRLFAPIVTQTSARITSLDLATGAFTTIVTLPPPAFPAWLAADPPWVAWVQIGSATSFNDASVIALNTDTAEQVTLVAPSPRSGLPTLLVRQGRVVWVQPTREVVHGGRRIATGEVRVYDLAAHRQFVLDRAGVGPPVFAGRYLLWGNLADSGTVVLRAADARTLRPVELPVKLPALHPGTDVAGSSNYLVWTTDQAHAVAWRIDRNQLTSYRVDGDHLFQLLAPVGHFVFWFTTDKFTVLDLESGGGYDLDGQVMASETAIMRAPARLPVTENASTVVSVLPTTSAPGIPACASQRAHPGVPPRAAPGWVPVTTVPV